MANPPLKTNWILRVISEFYLFLAQVNCEERLFKHYATMQHDSCNYSWILRGFKAFALKWNDRFPFTSHETPTQ